MGIKWVCFRVGIYRRRVAGNAGGIFGRALAGGCSLWASRFVASFENVVVNLRISIVGTGSGSMTRPVGQAMRGQVSHDVGRFGDRFWLFLACDPSLPIVGLGGHSQFDTGI